MYRKEESKGYLEYRHKKRSNALLQPLLTLNLYYEKHIAKIRTIAKLANNPRKKVCFITLIKNWVFQFKFY